MQTVICVGSVHLSGLLVYKVRVQVYISQSFLLCQADYSFIDFGDNLLTGSMPLEHIVMVGDGKNTLQI